MRKQRLGQKWPLVTWPAGRGGTRIWVCQTPECQLLHGTKGPPLLCVRAPRQPHAPPLPCGLRTCARSCAVSWWEPCSCCSISFSTCLCMATCSCRCWFRAWDSLRACLVLEDSTSTVLMTYCKVREGRAHEGVGRLHLPPGPEAQLAWGKDPRGQPTKSPWKKTRESMRFRLSRTLRGLPGIFLSQ